MAKLSTDLTLQAGGEVSGGHWGLERLSKILRAPQSCWATASSTPRAIKSMQGTSFIHETSKSLMAVPKGEEKLRLRKGKWPGITLLPEVAVSHRLFYTKWARLKCILCIRVWGGGIGYTCQGTTSSVIFLSYCPPCLLRQHVSLAWSSSSRLGRLLNQS